MSKKKFSQIRGISLVELLIGIVITSIMMTAMYTSYNVVNKTYSQVSERAKISRSSRDLVSMLMRDIRMSGFRYYAGTHTISKFASDTQSATGTECENYPNGMLLSKTSYCFNDIILRSIFNVILSGIDVDIFIENFKKSFNDFLQTFQ